MCGLIHEMPQTDGHHRQCDDYAGFCHLPCVLISVVHRCHDAMPDWNARALSLTGEICNQDLTSCLPCRLDFLPMPQPGVLTLDMVCAGPSQRQSRRTATGDAVHRPSRSTHSVAAFGRPFGLRFGGHLPRRVAQPYQGIRFSPPSLHLPHRNSNAGRVQCENSWLVTPQQRD